jgi:hypothetical protein
VINFQINKLIAIVAVVVNTLLAELNVFGCRFEIVVDSYEANLVHIHNLNSSFARYED